MKHSAPHKSKALHRIIHHLVVWYNKKVNVREKRIILGLIGLLVVLGGFYFFKFYSNQSNHLQKERENMNRPLTAEEINAELQSLARPRASSSQPVSLSKENKALVESLASPPTQQTKPSQTQNSNPYRYTPPPAVPLSSENKELFDSLATPRQNQ